ncbi:hypothetical protein K402DRAFT_396487 [Aulographum hederae CBS 113979]|uniref:DNA repair and recombination protein RAD26 n=1 Tax=Aulographum hederae CBS 113979 TaxID=1176131 RepID=A0A6G1GS22_9PEZI|nr:hypothetical protein K402DRAFT_396487 [Aulographum hederae CBS 113979]
MDKGIPNTATSSTQPAMEPHHVLAGTPSQPTTLTEQALQQPSLVEPASHTTLELEPPNATAPSQALVDPRDIHTQPDMDDMASPHSTADPELRLTRLVTIRDQAELELDVGQQAERFLLEQADERDKKQIEKAKARHDRLVGQINKVLRQLKDAPANAKHTSLVNEKAVLEAQVKAVSEELGKIEARMEQRHKASEDAKLDHGTGKLPGESQRDFLIRTGKITPFTKMKPPPTVSENLEEVMRDAEQAGEGMDEDELTALEAAANAGPVSHRNLLKPGFAEAESSSSAVKRKRQIEEDAELAAALAEQPKRVRLQSRSATAAHAQSGTPASSSDSEESYIPPIEELGFLDDERDPEADGFVMDTPATRKPSRGKDVQKSDVAAEDDQEDLTGLDDGNEQLYRARLKTWVHRRSQARRKEQSQDEHDKDEEWFMPHPTRQDTELAGGLRIPGDIYPSLFDYQKTCVQWLWEMYSQNVGGIIGDEMGLGKTIQMISFLAALHYSKKLDGPIIIVTPATVMKQWVKELHTWWPPMRVSILHSSGSGMMNIKREAKIEDCLEIGEELDESPKKPTKAQRTAQKIVDRVVRDGHVLITTYTGLQTYARNLIPVKWGYAVLDEGHKIRNPNTAITIYCKELRTPNRCILSGTPMQNNLTELWSLFDFVFPMRLGNLVDFRTQFETPIKLGGFASASSLAIELATKCAQTLKDTIHPYLLQRMKKDVAADLPKKTERTLFCSLTKPQRRAYQWFLSSEQMTAINEGKMQPLYGIDFLRKICNHPDLMEHKTLPYKANYDYGSPELAGKMEVVKNLLEIWKRGGHKALLFTQSRIMLDILEKYIKNMAGFNYRRMDGNTSIKVRQTLVDEFNQEPDLHVFLLTTKVGGLGVNLTGANRIIIYDPDWNPSTDIQARERAWRLGQKREVQIYRLIMAGTIEEKIYHRQLFKQFLSDKILRDPKQRQTFQLKDLSDLFSFSDATGKTTETSALFQGTEVKFSGGSPGKTSASPPADATRSGTESDDLSNVAGIARQEEHATPEDNDAGENQSDRLLSAIFDRSGVHSALEHDAIVASNNTKRTIGADPVAIRREAKRMADIAAKELEKNAEVARNVEPGTVTWTGTHGTVPESREQSDTEFGRRGISAGRGRQLGSARRAGRVGRGGRAPGDGEVGVASSRVLTSFEDRHGYKYQPSAPPLRVTLPMIKTFFLRKGGSAPSAMLWQHYDKYVQGEVHTAQFRALVESIATQSGGTGDGRGIWTLKAQFKRGS